MSSSDPISVSILRRGFVDICRGYSTALYHNQTVYIRHLGHHEHLDYDLLQERLEQDVITKGARTDAQRREQLVKQGHWSDAKDMDIERTKDTIARFEQARRNLNAPPSVLASHDKQTQGFRDHLNKLLNERANLFGITAETYAQQLLNDHYIITNLFKDSQLRQPLFDEDTFDNMPNSDVEEVMETYRRAVEPCNEVNIRRLVVADFFTSYYSLATDAVDFLGKPIYQMTYYQVSLMGRARHYRAIFESVDMSTVDAKTRNDPDAIDRLYDTQKAKDNVAATGNAPVGMTTDDIKEMGLEGKITQVDKEMSGLDIVRQLARNQR